MEIDILSPEFLDLADKARNILNEKEAKVEAFKKVWVEHKKEIAELEASAEKLKTDYIASMKMAVN